MREWQTHLSKYVYPDLTYPTVIWHFCDIWYLAVLPPCTLKLYDCFLQALMNTSKIYLSCHALRGGGRGHTEGAGGRKRRKKLGVKKIQLSILTFFTIFFHNCIKRKITHFFLNCLTNLKLIKKNISQKLSFWLNLRGNTGQSKFVRFWLVFSHLFRLYLTLQLYYLFLCKEFTYNCVHFLSPPSLTKYVEGITRSPPFF